MNLRVVIAAVGLALASLAASASSPQRAQRNAKVAIFVGPQTNGGVVQIDAGIQDSIRDIQSEFRRSPRFRLVTTPEGAEVILLVLGRRLADPTGAVGVQSGSTTVVSAIRRRAIDVLLRVGSYEKTFTSMDDRPRNWKGAARRVTNDVTAWANANRPMLSPK